MKKVKLAELPAIGLRAPFRTDAEWRDILISDKTGWGIGWLQLPTGPVFDLACALYHAGPLVLPPDATIDELIEAAIERAVEPPDLQPPALPN